MPPSTPPPASCCGSSRVKAPQRRPAVAAGTVYWGNGYAHFLAGGGTPSRTFYAFSVP